MLSFKDLEKYLLTFPFSAYLYSFSAFDRYYGKKEAGIYFIKVRTDLITLAKSIQTLEYPGVQSFDAQEFREGSVLLFSLEDSQDPTSDTLNYCFIYDISGRKYLDPEDLYRKIRNKEYFFDKSETTEALLREAVFCSRYGFGIYVRSVEREKLQEIPVFLKRLYLNLTITGDCAEKGLQFLLDAGILEQLLPELLVLSTVDHSKEHHPEGNGWEHTLQTLQHRKTRDLAISLALLFHDIGKPDSFFVDNEKPFDGHAQIGVTIARKILRRFEYPEELVEEVLFLIRNHMIPGALGEIPVYRIEQTLNSPWFPKLLEVFRCDLLSTFSGPEKYYRACKVYKQYLKNLKNPYRDKDGKINAKLYVE